LLKIAQFSARLFEKKYDNIITTMKRL